MQKKSQITIFIIIGSIMIGSALLFFYFKSAIAQKPEAAMPESAPAKIFVEDCMRTIAKEGITLLGLNGGYITLPREIANNPLSYMSSGISPTIPYWWHDGISRIPSEEDIKKQIADYVNANLKECLNNFRDFEDIYTVEEKGEIATKVLINEEDVAVEVSYPLEITSTTNKTKSEIARYRAALPIRLKKAYELAKAIMERENIEGFIEQKTIDLMVLAGEETIPLNDVDVSCSEKAWLVSDIKKELRELLRRNLQFIKIAGTNYNDQSYIPIPSVYSRRQTFNESYYNIHYVWRVAENPPKDMRVAFIYDDNSSAWNMDMYARPSKGNVLKSNAQKGFDMLRLFCLHIWHFTYDISFPIIATIRDDKTSSHDEFSFIFAFKANIDHNQPARSSSATNVIMPSDAADSEEFCSELSNDVTINTEDKITNEPVADVNLTFVCGGYNCKIGVTEWVSYGASAGLTTKFPYCVQGIIRGAAEGYDESQAWIQTNLKGKAYALPMTPIKQVQDYSVVKHSFKNGAVEPMEQELEDGEKATITIKRIEKNIDDAEFETFGAYPSLTAEPYPIKLLAKDDFKYYIEAYLIKDDTIVGGYKGNWTLYNDELKRLNRLKFHVIKTDTKDEMERYAFVESLQTYSKEVSTPELIG